MGDIVQSAREEIRQWIQCRYSLSASATDIIDTIQTVFTLMDPDTLYIHCISLSSRYNRYVSPFSHLGDPTGWRHSKQTDDTTTQQYNHHTRRHGTCHLHHTHPTLSPDAHPQPSHYISVTLCLKRAGWSPSSLKILKGRPGDLLETLELWSPQIPKMLNISAPPSQVQNF